MELQKVTITEFRFQKGHLKVTKMSGISPINKCIMEIEKTNKVTEMVKKDGKIQCKRRKMPCKVHCC